MTTTDYIFRTVLLSAAVVSFMLGHFLLALKTQKGDIYKPYRDSKRLVAASYLVMSLDLFIWFVDYDDEWVWPRAIFYNYILYYVICILFSYGFCHLLNHHYITRKRMMWDGITFAITSGFAIASWVVDEGMVEQALSLIANLLLICYIVAFILNFRKLYFRNVQILSNYYSEDMRRLVSWINKSIFLLVAFAFMSVFVMFQGIIVNILFQLYAIALNVYLVTTFLNYGFKVAELERVYHDWDVLRTTNPQAEQQHETDESKSAMESKLKVWIASKQYLSMRFTIDTVAQEVGTNRNYLSRYINEHYHENFSEWVAKLRIAESKVLMRQLPNSKLEDIAYRSGFSSASYFSKVFSRIVGISPARWRESKSLYSEGGIAIEAEKLAVEGASGSKTSLLADLVDAHVLVFLEQGGSITQAIAHDEVLDGKTVGIRADGIAQICTIGVHCLRQVIDLEVGIGEGTLGIHILTEVYKELFGSGKRPCVLLLL